MPKSYDKSLKILSELEKVLQSVEREKSLLAIKRLNRAIKKKQREAESPN